MKFSDVELPSNKKFGIFFGVFFKVVCLYQIFQANYFLASLFFVIGVIFILIAFYKNELLLPLNKLWMRLGMLLGLLVTPMIFGLIFFGLIAPLGIFIRVLGRDELRLKIMKKQTYWVPRIDLVDNPSRFIDQY